MAGGERRWGGMEFVPGALGKLSGGSVSGGSGKREPTPPSRVTNSFRDSSGLPNTTGPSHTRSASDTLDPRVPARPTGSTVGGGRPLSGGSRSSSRDGVNQSTSPNPTQFQTYMQENFDGGGSTTQPQQPQGGGSGGPVSATTGSVTGDYIQRCVIIQRGEKGYGLTVSGDNPVFVQDVKPHGAAARAGVQPGDRIMKVNGTLVTSSNHVEVVRMIKSGSLVSLTLMGRPPGSGGPSVSNRSRQSELNNANNVQHHPADAPELSGIDDMALAKLRTSQNYLTDALAERDNLAAEYKKHPNDRSYGKILENNRLIEQLHAQLQDAARKAGVPLPPSSYSDENTPPITGAKFPYPQDSVSSTGIVYPSSHDEHATPHHDLLGMTGVVDSGGGSQSPTSSPMAQSLSFGSTRFHDDDDDDDTDEPTMALFTIGEGSERPTPTPSESIYPSSPDSRLFPPSTTDASPVSPGVPSFPAGLPPTAPPFPSLSMALTNPTSTFGSAGGYPIGGGQFDNSIITMEDDDLQEDIANNESDPFNDFGKLKQHPAHLAVFLRFLIHNSDPSCLFFFLITESYASSSSNIKDLKRWAYEISSTFLFEGSPLALNIDEMEEYVKKVNEILESKNLEKESDLRNIFGVIRNHAREIIIDTLSTFRQNRQIGLGGFYGEQFLKEPEGKLKEPAKQLRVVESLLLEFLKDWTDNFSEKWMEEMTDRNQALAFCLVTFFKLYGLEKVSKQSDLEKIPVFILKQNNRGIRGLTGGGAAAKGEKKEGHSLHPYQYTQKTECDQCKSLLWGIGTLQGYQCKHCYQNFHKSCLGSIEKECSTDKNKGLFRFPKGPKSTTGSSVKDDAKDEPPRTRRSTSPSLNGKKEPSPATEPGVDDEPPPKNDGPSIGLNRADSMKQQNSMKEPKKVARSKSDPKSDPDDVRTRNSGQLSSPASASQSSLDSNGSTTVPESDNDSAKISDAPEAPPSTSGSVVSEPIMGASEFLSSVELPKLEEIIASYQLEKMNKKEKEKQKVINELFHTELTHVRHLQVLEELFSVPMRNEHIMSKEDLDTLFPNLSEVINIHKDLQQAMKIRREESKEGPVDSVSDILLDRFQGVKGEKFRETCANFLKNQGYALDMLRDKKKKDPKLAKFLQEKEEDQRCRRLQFKDLLPEEMQRIVKYPILLESLAKHLEKESSEHKGILEAIKESKAITIYVNMATRDCQNKHTLQDIQKKLDTSPWDRSNHPLVPEFKNLDVTQRGELIHEGDLEWRLKSNRSNIKLRVLLFQDFIILLTRVNAGANQSKQDEKYVLKSQGTAPQTHSPIIRVKHVLYREVATERRAFFLIYNDTDHKNGGDNKAGAYTSLYELEARSQDEKKRWQEYIDAAVKAAGGASDSQRFYANRTSEAPIQTNLTKTSAGVTIIKPASPDEEGQVSDNAPSQEDQQGPSRDVNGGSLGSLSTSTLTGGEGAGGDAVSSQGNLGAADDTLDSLTTPLTPLMGDLVQPTEVTVHKINASSAIVSKTGETLTSPHDQLKSKDAQIHKLLKEKQRILASIHRLPTSSEFADMAEVAATSVSEDGHRQPKNSGDMLLAAWHQVQKLTYLMMEHQTLHPPPSSATEGPPPLPPAHQRRESSEMTREAKSASLGRNAFLQEPNQRNRHTSSPAISTSLSTSSSCNPIVSIDNNKNSLTQQQSSSHELSAIPTSMLVPVIISLQENLSSLLSVMEISPSSCPADSSHFRMVRSDSIPPYPPPPPPPPSGIPPDETSVAPPASTVAPPTPFAGGFRCPKPNETTGGPSGDRGARKEVEIHSNPSCESSPSPIPICPPPPKDLLLPTSTSTTTENDDDEDVIMADEECEVENADLEFTPDHSASSTPLPPPRPHGRGGGRSPLDNTSLSPSSKNSPHKSLSPDRPIDQPAVARSSLSPARSSPKPTSPLSQRHLVSNNHLVMEEGEESFIDDDVDDDSHLLNASNTGAAPSTAPGEKGEPEKRRKTKKKKKKNNSNDSSVNSATSVNSGASNSSATLEGGVPFPTPRLEDDDDDFESNTTYV